MTQSWIGRARYLFIPLVVEGSSGFAPPPDDYQQYVERRVYYDPDLETGEDRSLTSYIDSVSYGRAALDVTVSTPVTVQGFAEDQSLTLLAIHGSPHANLFDFVAVVFPPNRIGAGSGMAQPGPVEFTPPRTPNLIKARSRFPFDAPIGTWAMEILHNVTGIGDYYNGINHPGHFDEMADAAATHPSAYTKLLAGWLDPETVPMHPGASRTYSLHALELSQPPSAGRVAAVRTSPTELGRYLIIEARLRADRWDGGCDGHAGIPSEGVVVYEFSPPSASWPRFDPHGPWPPLELRTPTALRIGESFTHETTGARVQVRAAIAGGFAIELATKEVSVPYVQGLPEPTAVERIRATGLQPRTLGPSGTAFWVWRQSPDAGTVVAPGSVVTLQFKSGPVP